MDGYTSYGWNDDVEINVVTILDKNSFIPKHLLRSNLTGLSRVRVEGYIEYILSKLNLAKLKPIGKLAAIYGTFAM